MALNPTVAVLLLLLLAVLVISAFLALRNRLSFRIAMRNVRRGRWRTVLLVLGLLIGTTIISGSLVIGDTVNAANVHFVYQSYGFTTIGIYNSSLTGGYRPFPYSTFVAINNSVKGDPQIAGIAPQIITSGQVLNLQNGVPTTGLTLVGANSNQTSQLGAFTATNGTSLAGPGAGQAYLDVIAANELSAKVGDPLMLVGAGRAPVVLAAIVNDDTRGGFFGGGNVFVDLATAQAVVNTPGMVNFLAVTTTGSLTETASLSGPVATTLNNTLAQLGHPYGLAAWPLLAPALAQAVTSGQSLAELFLVLGLFSIVAGAILIAGIVIMLAEERKGEMGMVRAIGLNRNQLVLSYYFEGIAYSAGGALAGTFVGVGLAYFLVYEFTKILATSSSVGSAVLDSFTYTTASLVIAYVVGFLLTLATVAIASRRVGQLNIVRAIRSIPEPPPTVRLYTRLAYVGAAVAAIGGVIYAFTYSGTSDISYPLIGGALIILGGALVASRFVRNRIAFSIAGALLLVWGGYADLHRFLLGTQHSDTIFVAFVEGIILVGGAVMLYLFNASALVAAFTRIASVHPQSAPVVRVGLAYPARRGTRTAINLTIFALVLFTVVAVASIGASLQQNLNHTIQAESGGYTFVSTSAAPIPNLPQQVQANATLSPLFSAVVPMAVGGVQVSVPGYAAPYSDALYAAPTGVPDFENFYTTNQFGFQATLGGLSASAVWQQLATDPNATVLDATYGSPTAFFTPPAGHPMAHVGQVINVTNPANGRSASLQVIGIMTQMGAKGIWANPTTATALNITSLQVFFLTVSGSTDPTYAGQQLQIAFFSYGLFLYNYAQLIQSSIQQTQAIISLLEVFVALGLAVGIAAMGILALRAVVERRSEIGMLRATGFTQGMVFRTFFLEYSFVALLGIAIGTGLGLLVAYNLSTSTNASTLLAFTVPWVNIGIVVGIAYALVVAAIAGPSIRASRLPPAEAIRYSE